jgi:hypothetical protein
VEKVYYKKFTRASNTSKYKQHNSNKIFKQMDKKLLKWLTKNNHAVII